MCIACGKCGETGRCVFDDIVNIVLEKTEKVDAIVPGTPVYFASPNSSMIAFMDGCSIRVTLIISLLA